MKTRYEDRYGYADWRNGEGAKPAHMDEMLGKVMVEVRNDGDELLFVDMDGTLFTFYHENECCESVSIDDIEGDLDFLVNSPILLAERVSSTETDDLPPAPNEYGYSDDSYTWTFFKFATIKGTVVVKWYGSSNGYYSEDVSFKIMGVK